MFCHGELARLKPAPRYLTRFYLMISLGGAVGSVLVGIVAPLVLPGYFELAAGSSSVALLLLWQVRRDPPVFGVLGLVAAAVERRLRDLGRDRVLRPRRSSATRNFYGVLRVQERGADDVAAAGRWSTARSCTARSTSRRRCGCAPTTYYTRRPASAACCETLHPRLDPIRVGVIGLGTGTLAVYGSKGDVYRFYDINPDVLEAAQRDFTFLSDSDATIESTLGDARLALEREPPQNFDVLVVDAFSSDAIPVHLITSEAVAIYKRHLKPGGVIAFHVTNRFLNLVPVVEALAAANGLAVIHIPDEGADPVASRSDWVLLSTNTELFANPELAEHTREIVARRDWRLWTDDFNNLVQVLK